MCKKVSVEINLLSLCSSFLCWNNLQNKTVLISRVLHAYCYMLFLVIWESNYTYRPFAAKGHVAYPPLDLIPYTL